MSDGYAATDGCWPGLPRHMHDCAVLDIRALADMHIPDNDRVFGDEHFRPQRRHDITKGPNYHGNKAPCSKPVVSSYPYMTFIFCTACPDAPLTRLSSTLTMMALPGTRSANTP